MNSTLADFLPGEPKQMPGHDCILLQRMRTIIKRLFYLPYGDRGLHPHIELHALGARDNTYGERHAPKHPLSAPHPFPGSEARPWRTPQEVLRADIQQVCGRISLRRICHRNDNATP